MKMFGYEDSTVKDLFTRRHGGITQPAIYDKLLLIIALSLMTIGFIIVTSASIPVAERLHNNPFHFATRHGIYLLISLVVGAVCVQVPMRYWKDYNHWLLFVALALLIVVLFIGRTVNGSTRWIALGPITIQAAEPAKLFFFCYLASFLVRRYEDVTENWGGFVKPLAVFFVLATLLLQQPDLGTVVVMFVTTVGLLFLAGARLIQFYGLLFTGLLSVVSLIVIAPYRMRRLESFMDPWSDPWNTGYQLTQSLMAFGRGDWFGQGLGNSLQKLEYLPEAHTDFIVAVLAEEFGFIGLIGLLSLIFVMVFRALKLGNRAIKLNRPFEAYFSYGIGIWFSFQTAVNVGASSGMLPTKGLTLPLVSYGGSSLIVMTIAVCVLLRIDYELRQQSEDTLEQNDASIEALQVGSKA